MTSKAAAEERKRARRRKERRALGLEAIWKWPRPLAFLARRGVGIGVQW